MIAQSALRCSWTDFSIGANGSTAGFGVEDAFVGLVSPFFAGWLVEGLVKEEAEADVVLGVLGDSARYFVDESTRILEALVI